jgi:hypothetical protein
LPIHGSYSSAAEYLADTLETIGNQYSEDHEDDQQTGNDFLAMAKECLASIAGCADAWTGTGPDGYIYSINETEPRAVFVADEGENLESVTLSVSPGLGEPTAEEIRAEVQSIAGSQLEVADGSLAYAIVSVDDLETARAELREAGYGLDLSYWPTVRETLGNDLGNMDCFRLDAYRALDAGVYETLDEETRAARIVGLAGSSVPYSALESAKGGVLTDAVTVGCLSGSDYNGGALVRSNIIEFRKLLAEDSALERIGLDTHGGYGTDGVLVLIDVRTTSAAAGKVVAVLKGLLDYPCIDEEALSKLETDEAEDEWRNGGADRDYCRALEERHGLEDVETGSDGELRELFDVRAEVGNVNGGPGVIHEECGPCFLTQEVAAETPAALLGYIGLLPVSGLDGLALGVDEPDEARRILRILKVGQVLRYIVGPALVRGFIREGEATAAGDIERRAYVEGEARRLILGAEVDEGDTTAEIDADAWDSVGHRLVTVTLRRYVYGPGREIGNRSVTVEIDPRTGGVRSGGADAAVSGLFRS